MSTPQQIQAAIGITETALYTAFTSTATRGQLGYLSICNTTGSLLSVDVYYKNSAGSTSRYLINNAYIPANGQLDWRGLLVLSTAGESINAIASDVGLDALGAVLET